MTNEGFSGGQNKYEGDKDDLLHMLILPQNGPIVAQASSVHCQPNSQFTILTHKVVFLFR